MSAPIAISVVDEMPGAGRRLACTLSVPERLTARELIAQRVTHVAIDRDEVPAAPPEIARALDAFTRRRFMLLVGDRQIESLDEEIVLGPGSEVCFYKLTPLVGG